jgi:hypothetical protein
MNKFIVLATIVMFVCAIIVILNSPLSNAATNASFQTDPSSTVRYDYTSFNVNVTLANVTDMMGYQFRIYWSNSVLNCTNATVYAPSSWNGTTQFGDGIEQSYNGTFGAYDIGLCPSFGNWKTSNPFNGSMTLVHLSFVPLAVGTTYPSFDSSLTKLGNESGLPITCTYTNGYVNCMFGRYFRADAATINGLNAYLFNCTETASLTTKNHNVNGNQTSIIGIRAYMRCPNGTQVELILDGQTGTPKACVNPTGVDDAEYSNTTVVSSKTWVTNASLVISVIDFTGGSQSVMANFTTEQLNTASLSGTIWTVYYWASHVYNSFFNKTGTWFSFGDTSEPSRITNLVVP